MDHGRLPPAWDEDDIPPTPTSRPAASGPCCKPSKGNRSPCVCVCHRRTGRIARTASSTRDILIEDDRILNSANGCIETRSLKERNVDVSGCVRAVMPGGSTPIPTSHPGWWAARQCLPTVLKPERWRRYKVPHYRGNASSRVKSRDAIRPYQPTATARLAGGRPLLTRIRACTACSPTWDDDVLLDLEAGRIYARALALPRIWQAG